MHCSVAITYFNTAMRLSLLSFHVFSLEHKASEIMMYSNLFLNNIYQQFFFMPRLGKDSVICERNIKINSFLV